MKQVVTGFPTSSGNPAQPQDRIKIFANEVVMNTDQLYTAADDGTLRFCRSPIDRAFLDDYTTSELENYISAFVFEVDE